MPNRLTQIAPIKPYPQFLYLIPATIPLGLAVYTKHQSANYSPNRFALLQILFFVPFYDYRVNRRRLERIKEAMHLSRLNPL